jgi:hypothetical protein
MDDYGVPLFILAVGITLVFLISASEQKAMNQHERSCAARNSIAVLTVGGERACVPGVYAYEGE